MKWRFIANNPAALRNGATANPYLYFGIATDERPSYQGNVSSLPKRPRLVQERSSEQRPDSPRFLWMTQEQRNLLGIVGLATAGFLSGLAFPDFPSWGSVAFPVAIALALWLCCQIRSAKLIFFVAAGFISAPAAFAFGCASSFIAPAVFSEGVDSPQYMKHIFVVGGTVSGFVGAAVFIGAFYFLLFPQPGFRRWLMKTVRWSCVGGVLAMAGLAMENAPNRSMKFAVVLWQAGMGALLGALMWWERRRVASELPDATLADDQGLEAL